jgi:hypothetical protein
MISTGYRYLDVAKLGVEFLSTLQKQWPKQQLEALSAAHTWNKGPLAS